MNYDTIKLLNLEDIDIDLSKSFITKENIILNCTIVLNEQKQCCPKCMSINFISHGYYIKTITRHHNLDYPYNYFTTIVSL